ncbi:MAG: ABC transporter permease, partial [Chloroflexota bacterium]
YSPFVMSPDAALAGPSAQHLFGTDEFGRDLLSRVIWGARISLGTAAAVVAVSAAIGIPLGLITGYFRGAVDTAIMRFIDAILAFPAILLAMGLIAVLGQSTLNGIIAVTVVSIPAFARLSRASTLEQGSLDYVTAAVVLGASHRRILFRTILPNALPPLIVQAAFTATQAVLLEASLSFLGLGTKPPNPSWGGMLSTSRDYLYRSPTYGLFPGILLAVLVMALNSLADGLQRSVSGRSS